MTVHKAHQQMKSAWIPLVNFACQSHTAAKSHGTSKGQILGLLNDLAECNSNSVKVVAYQPLSNFTPSSTTREPPNTRNRQEKCNKFHILYTYMIFPYISKLWPYNAMICYTHLCILGMLQRARLSRCTNRQNFPTCW